MRTDHAIVINKEKDLIEMVEYLSRKANRLGIQGRELVRVYVQEDSEGKHVYFETKEPRESISLCEMK